jgi:predicted transposase/invertase (TIGR01784 family)
MPDYHDVFWRLLFQRIDCAKEFFRFLLEEKAEFLELENLVFIQEIFYRKKKLLYDILYEIPIRNSNQKLYLEAIMGKRVLTAYERALEEGELKGEFKKALETAQKMLEKGFSVSEIQEITGLSEDQLKENGIL